MKMFTIIFCMLLLTAFGAKATNAIDQSICASGEKVELYPNGALKSCAMKDDANLEDIKCKGQSPISFYNNGRIETCILAQSITISGQKCNEFGPISFYPDGKFKSCLKEN